MFLFCYTCRSCRFIFVGKAYNCGLKTGSIMVAPNFIPAYTRKIIMTVTAVVCDINSVKYKFFRRLFSDL